MPIFQHEESKPCTAILNLDTLHWSTLPQKGPFLKDKHDSFYLISDENKENIFLLGGGSLNRKFGHVYNHLNPRLDVQRLDKEGWHRLPGSNIEYPMNRPIAKVPLDLYRNNNWPNLDPSKLQSKGENTTI